MAKTPTNTDIANLIQINHEETVRRLSGVEEQVKLTNGRVRSLELSRAEEKAYKQGAEDSAKKQPTTVTTQAGDVIVQANAEKITNLGKVYLAIAGAITVLSVAVSAWLSTK